MSEPLIDIVVLVHDKADWARLCIESVESFTKNSYRLIIVDSASEQAETKVLLEDFKRRGHTVLHLAQNRSFSDGVNAGVNAGTAKYVCVLNDDAIVTEGWDSALIQDATPKDVGLVGARSNYAAGAQGGARCIGDPPYLVFVCVAMRREVWERVGPLDSEQFQGFGAEDLDYSWRVVKHGLRLVLSSAFVLHAGSRTLVAKLGGAEALNANNERLNIKLLEKWGKDWVYSHTKLAQKVLVATYSPQEVVSMDFARSCMALKQAGGYEFSFYSHKRSPIHIARQLVVDYALRENCDVLVQLDDDATFPADLLPKLLAHNKELVCGLAYQRKKPYATVVYELDVDAFAKGKISGSHMERIEHTGLRKVDVSGLHVSALRLSLIKKMRAFRSEKYPDGITEYFGGFDKCGEDFAFAAHVKLIGAQLYVDTDLIVGHIAEPFVIDEHYVRAHREGRAQ